MARRTITWQQIRRAGRHISATSEISGLRGLWWAIQLALLYAVQGGDIPAVYEDQDH